MVFKLDENSNPVFYYVEFKENKKNDFFKGVECINYPTLKLKLYERSLELVRVNCYISGHAEIFIEDELYECSLTLFYNKTLEIIKSIKSYFSDEIISIILNFLENKKEFFKLI